MVYEGLFVPAQGSAHGRPLIRQAARIDVITGENDHHRSAAHLAIIVHFRRHLVGMGNGDFKHLKAGRAGDFGELHGGRSHSSGFSQPSASPYCSAFDGLAQHVGARHQQCTPLKNDTRVSFSDKPTRAWSTKADIPNGLSVSVSAGGGRETKFAVISRIWHADRLKIKLHPTVPRPQTAQTPADRPFWPPARLPRPKRPPWTGSMAKK